MKKNTDIKKCFLIVLKTCAYLTKERSNRKRSHDIDFSVKDFDIQVEDVCVMHRRLITPFFMKKIIGFIKQCGYYLIE